MFLSNIALDTNLSSKFSLLWQLPDKITTATMTASILANDEQALDACQQLLANCFCHLHMLIGSEYGEERGYETAMWYFKVMLSD